MPGPLKPCGIPSSFPRTFQIFLSKVITNSTSPAVEPRLKKLHLRFCWFSSIFKRFQNLVACWFLFIKLVTSWFCSFTDMYIDFSPRETGFNHIAFCVLIFVHETCCMLIFLFVKHVHWFFNFLLVKLILIIELLRADFRWWNFLHDDFC